MLTHGSVPDPITGIDHGLQFHRFSRLEELEAHQFGSSRTREKEEWDILTTAIGSWRPRDVSRKLRISVNAAHTWRTRDQMLQLFGRLGRLVEDDCSSAYHSRYITPSHYLTSCVLSEASCTTFIEITVYNLPESEQAREGELREALLSYFPVSSKHQRVSFKFASYRIPQMIRGYIFQMNGGARMY